MDGDALIGADGEFARENNLACRSSICRTLCCLPRESGDRRTPQLLSELFGDEFAALTGGKATDSNYAVASVKEVAGDMVVVDAVRANPEATRRIVALQACVADVLLFNCLYSDIGRREAFDTEILRIMLTQLHKFSAPEKLRTCLLVVVSDHNDGSDPAEIERLVRNRIRSLWVTCRPDRRTSLKSFLHVEVRSLQHPKIRRVENPRAVAALRSHISKLMESRSYTKEIDGSSFVTYARFLWNSTADMPEEMRPARFAELVAIHDCDVEFERQSHSTWRTIDAWRDRVQNSRLIDDFGFQASRLHEQAMQSFDETTSHLLTSSVRSARREELSGSVADAIRKLFLDQMKIFQRQAYAEVKEGLVADLKRQGTLSTAQGDSLILKALNRFCAEAENFEVPGLRISAYAARIELEDALNVLAAGFGSSPTAQSVAVRIRERENRMAYNESHIRGNVFPGVSVGAGLTSELRTGGFGNAQLYYSYANGPHSVNFAFANDADAILQEGTGAVSTVRLQPTLRFDVDLPAAVDAVGEHEVTRFFGSLIGRPG